MTTNRDSFDVLVRENGKQIMSFETKDSIGSKMKRVMYGGKNILMKKLEKYLLDIKKPHLVSYLRFYFDEWCGNCYYSGGHDSDICYHIKGIGDCEYITCPVNYYFKSDGFEDFKRECKRRGVDLSDFEKKYFNGLNEIKE